MNEWPSSLGLSLKNKVEFDDQWGLPKLLIVSVTYYHKLAALKASTQMYYHIVMEIIVFVTVFLPIPLPKWCHNKRTLSKEVTYMDSPIPRNEFDLEPD